MSPKASKNSIKEAAEGPSSLPASSSFENSVVERVLVHTRGSDSFLRGRHLLGLTTRNARFLFLRGDESFVETCCPLPLGHQEVHGEAPCSEVRCQNLPSASPQQFPFPPSSRILSFSRL